MTIAVAVTDIDWFFFLRSEGPLSEVNFWTPTGWNVTKLQPGERLYFLLKAPHRQIAGYGHFKYFHTATAEEAWASHGRGNGVSSCDELVAKINQFPTTREAGDPPSPNPEIGCIVLDRVVYLDDEAFFTLEEKGLDFAPNIVKFKYFHLVHLGEPEYHQESMWPTFQLVGESKTEYAATVQKQRHGQSEFRQKVLRAYNYRCCITGESSLDVIQAAHIELYKSPESNHVQNGLPLRLDLHRLFDLGLITLNDDFAIVISPHLDSDYYRAFDGKSITLPGDERDRPSLAALAFHRENIFRT